MNSTRYNGLTIAEDGVEPVQHEAKDVASHCHACVFNTDARGCNDHACFGVDFPDTHPLRDVSYQIIWVRKESA